MKEDEDVEMKRSREHECGNRQARTGNMKVVGMKTGGYPKKQEAGTG
jgi:hypothetical protein